MADSIKLSHHVRRWRIVSRAIGAYLVLAALLKLFALTTSTPSSPSFFAFRPGWTVVAIELELSIGVCLIAGLLPVLMWITSLFLFGVFLTFSLISAANGQVDCGCLGAVQVSPWLVATLDVFIIVLALLSRPFSNGGEFRSAIVSNRRVVIWGLVVLLVVAAVPLTLSQNQTVRASLARLRGESMIVTPTVRDLPVAKHGSGKCTVVVRNISDETVTILGGTTSCRCITTHSLPQTVKPGDSAELEMIVKTRKQEGSFAERYILFTDCTNQPRVVGWIRGTISETL